MQLKKALIEKKTGTVIFYIPDSKDSQEKVGSLAQQIYARLITFSNMYNDYNRAIDEVQGYLRALCNHCPEEKLWIVKSADIAGEKFLSSVTEAKERAFRTTIERGEMFLKVKKITGGNQKGD